MQKCVEVSVAKIPSVKSIMLQAHADNVRLLAQPAHLSAGRFHLLARKMADDLTYGTDPSRFVGPGIDYAQTRIMQLGDSVRAIDWRVTARTGTLHVKDYEASKRLGVYLLVDTSASMSASSTEISKHDVAVWCVALLAQLALNRRSQVSVVSCGERAIPGKPSSARSQVTTWVEGLRHRSFDEGTNLLRAITTVETLARHRALMVIISDLYQPGAAGAIKRMAQRHDVIVIRPVDPAERGALNAGYLRAAEAEQGDLGAFLAGGRARWFGDDRDDVDADPLGLVGAGVDLAVLATDRPIMPALRRVLNAKRGPNKVAR